MKSLLEMCPSRHSRLASRIIDGEAVIVSPTEGVITILNRVGSRIWGLSDGKKSLKDIADIISGEFEVTRETARCDAQEFIKDLSGKGMIKLAGTCHCEA